MEFGNSKNKAWNDLGPAWPRFLSGTIDKI